jgi:predicted ATPase
MITSLRLQNFKLFKDQSFEFKNLNLLTGLNGMGKSTAIQALLLLREAKFDRILLTEGLNLQNNKLFSVGQIKDLRYEFAEKPYHITINLGLDNKINSFRYDADEEGKEEEINSIALINKVINTNDIEKEPLFSKDNFVYLQADRTVPKYGEYYSKGIELKNKFGNEGQFAINFYHTNKTTFLVDKNLCLNETQTLETQVKMWLNYISPEINLSTKPIGNELLLEYSFGISATKFQPINVGFGITYCLPIIIALLSAKPNDLLIIENPESHLHPKGQSKLAELMCLAAQNGVQIFCETHSDHIFYGTRVAIKEGKVEPEKVKTYYFDRSKTEYNSVVHCININKKGRIIGDMPDGFFDQYEINLDKLL